MKSVKRVTNGHSSIDPMSEFTVEMNFTDDDPVAVRFGFSSSHDANAYDQVVWEFSRELLVAGVEKSVGTGDIVLTPAGDSLSILLRSPSGSIIIEVDLSDVKDFVDDMENVLPFGEEADVIEKQLESFLANPMGDSKDIRED